MNLVLHRCARTTPASRGGLGVHLTLRGTRHHFPTGTQMTVLYILLGIFVIWVAYKILAKPRQAPPSPQPEPLEIPIKITVSYDDGGYGRQPRDSIDKDEWEGSFWEVAQPLPAKARLRLKYLNP